MNKPITNIELKKIIYDLSFYIENFKEFNDIELINKFIDRKEFHERDENFISIKLESINNTAHSLFIEHNLKEDKYILRFKQLNFSAVKLFFYYTENSLQLSFNDCYWYEDNSLTFNKAFDILFNKKDLIDSYIEQKDFMVPFQYFVDNIEKYKKLNNIINY